jgi:hypothetical protein
MKPTDDELRRIPGADDFADALAELRRLRAAHEAMRPVIRQLEQFASVELAREAAPETCKAAQVVVDAWRAAEGETCTQRLGFTSCVLPIGHSGAHSGGPESLRIGARRIESALTKLGSEHVEPPDWQQGVWDQILDEKPSSK